MIGEGNIVFDAISIAMFSLLVGIWWDIKGRGDGE